MENLFYHIKWPPLNVTIFVRHMRDLHIGCYANTDLGLAGGLNVGLESSYATIFEPQHEISNNVVCAPSMAKTSLRIRPV